MRIIKWLAVLLGCLTVLTLPGCLKRRNPHMLDGPGMVYEPPWTAFTLSRSDSTEPYNFWFTVSDDGDQTLLTGECRDAEGGCYSETVGIRLSPEDLWKLHWMDLDTLDDQETPPEDATVKLSLVLPNGEVVWKKASVELSLEIYEMLLPYFKK